MRISNIASHVMTKHGTPGAPLARRSYRRSAAAVT